MSAPELYLFRYRNLLTKDTLGEHRKIIDNHGYCWWGWWRRPAEDAWLDVWQALFERTDAGEQVRIGLFDSEPGCREPVHFATVTKVIVPSADSRAPVLPDKESRWVPSYYREAPFSSAWMRLDAIEGPIAPFFGSYSFAQPPRLTGILTDDRYRYVNKRIIDADELRSMDTTIWVIRPAKAEDDRHERILAASANVTDALSSRPIELRSSRILHISDLHFTTPKLKREEHNWHLIGEGDSTLHARIVDALGSDPTSPKVGLVVISGDLTYVASEAEFYEAFRFVHALLGALQLGREHLVVVPGNHDLAWTKQRDDKWRAGLQVTAAPDAARSSYRKNFYERVFRHPAAPHLGMARRFVCPNGLSLEIGGLNSSGLEQGPNWFAGMGRVDDRAFEQIAQTLGWAQRDSLALRILVHHHHLCPTEDVLPLAEYEHGFGMASDAKKTLRNAARHGVQLVLHGHRHQPFIGAEQVYAELERSENPWALGRVGLIGAGSAGSTSVHGGENWFNVLDLHASRLDLTMYRAVTNNQSREAFRTVHHWTASLRPESGRLLLGDWEPRRKDSGRAKPAPA